MAFHDHFSGHAQAYREARPSYPPQVAEWVASLAPERGRVWDAGTGNGQLARLLTAHFSQVFATDASERQIAEAEPHDRISFACEPAEDVSLPDGWADAVTVAQAVHWFDLPRFYEAVRRVAREGAPLVLIGYDFCQISTSIDAVVQTFARQTVGPDWPPQRQLVEDRYVDLPFPFERIALDPISMVHHWRREEFLGYVGSWSSVQRYRKRTGTDPMIPFERTLAPLWSADERRHVTWDLVLVAGRVTAS